MSEHDDEFNDDIYSISDVVRNAQSLVIAVGQPHHVSIPQIPLQRDKGTEELLIVWGSRLWTFPEALLAPPRQAILVYTRDDENNPLHLSRMELVDRVWKNDRLRARELIDHLDGSLTLSRLEHVTIALGCLMSRTTGAHANGDVTYALMGLMRLRPTVDKTDSAFQAFARLSLANDSDKLLERMICLLPKNQSKFKGKDQHYWATMDDHWDANLWDVDPACQVAGIGESDTVIIDGAYAATVHWNSFQRVAITTKETWSRCMSRTFLRAAPSFLLIGIVGLVTGNNTAWAVPFLLLAAIAALLSPKLTLHIYGGKVWSTQPWLFGFEGHMPIEEIETKIFGFPQDRLTWTPYGSSLSEHRPRKSFLNNECRGIDPTRIKKTADLARRGVQAEYGESRVFTLVDTNMM
jgi:hypothetical protein